MIALRRTLAATMLMAIVLLSIYLLHGFSLYPSLPFKCLTFTRYDFSTGSQTKGPIFNVAHDLRFETPDVGYLLISGNVKFQDKETLIKRTIILDKGAALDKDTFRYHIVKIDKSVTDNTPDALFNQWFDEITPQSDTLQVDVVKLRSNALIIGSPVSFLFTCTPY
ncbi:FidL-like protein [Enterobacteriaceae bacterium C23F]